jgi:hypothetical protein
VNADVREAMHRTARVQRIDEAGGRTIRVDRVNLHNGHAGHRDRDGMPARVARFEPRPVPAASRFVFVVMRSRGPVLVRREAVMVFRVIVIGVAVDVPNRSLARR